MIANIIHDLKHSPETRVRVAYVISVVSSDGTGVGGSYRSLLALAQGMRSAGQDAKIFVLGDVFPSAYQNLDLPVEFVEFRNPLDYFPAICSRICAYAPTHIHAFDNKSYFFSRLVARKLDVPSILTRAGGPNPTRYFPYARDVVAFSEENASYFRNLPKLRASSIHLIPNRILDFDLCAAKESELRERLAIDGSELVVLRVCRIGLAYEESVRQAANLVRKLNAASIPSRLVVLGTIQDAESYARLQRIQDIRIDFVLDRKFTFNANELIGLGDIVVGVGRGFMEAALHGMIVLAPVSGCDVPALVLPENFDHLSRTNFSPRGFIPEFDESKNFSELLLILRNKDRETSHRNFVRSIAKARFSVMEGVRRHLQLYLARNNHGDTRVLDVALNFIVVLRFYVPIVIRRGFSMMRRTSAPTTSN
ncbi:hypothetical protein [Pseudoxanthomonas sp. GW2]|uniref:hypothetical protein n=1 Tax=Pseudoxanthomonas sp. GW2 TaxID=1211114 RepID=UPI0012E9AB63|nr:hypothetical protein [Pseudoxanthomonas sp. GW2]